MEAAVICEAMGWTLEEYETQPVDFIQTLTSMLNERAKAQQDALKKSST